MTSYPIRIILILLLTFPVFILTIEPASATGETYTLTRSPPRIQEANVSGLTLNLRVDNAMLSITYVFVFNVTEPGGTIRTASKSMLSTQSSWSVAANYPADFPGSSLSLVGNYSVVVSETLPSPIVSVATTKFQVGLTNSLSYQRTFPVSIKEWRIPSS